MIAVYQIKNLVTNQIYIGASNNIKRRIAEYKCPKRSHNPKLNADFKKYGINNFDFSIVEECSIENLAQTETDYIHKLNPYYNTIGKPLPKSIKRKISKTVKNVWNNLPQEKKDDIIQNNLKGPAKGHKVSESTRNKLRQANLGKKVFRPVVIVETDQEFINAVECAKFLGVSHSAVCYNLRGKVNKTKGYTIRYK